jgi:diguanylate cyclase (GGDEF)-like protein
VGWQAANGLVRLGVNSMSGSRAIGAKEAKAVGKKHARIRDIAREGEETSVKADITKKRSVAMRLAAKVDTLMSELNKSRARIAELETRIDEDPLTGLLNRRGLVKTLERSLAYMRRYGGSAALLFLDLDRFKMVNDRYGHPAGDWVLRHAARLIADHVRASDVVSRVGGDEFVVLLWNLRVEQADAKARALEELIATSPFELNGNRYVVEISVGLTMLAADDTSGTALARADQAMYVRKRKRHAGRS